MEVVFNTANPVKFTIMIVYHTPNVFVQLPSMGFVKRRCTFFSAEDDLIQYLSVSAHSRWFV
jgi:hypothetical protein